MDSPAAPFPWSVCPVAGISTPKRVGWGRCNDCLYTRKIKVGQAVQPDLRNGDRVPMPQWRRWISLGVVVLAVFHHGRPCHAAAEVKLGKDFLDGVVAKLPPTSFEKADKYRGTVHSYRLIAIDPRTRQFLIACQIEGEFHPPVTGPISDRVGRSPQTPEGWRKFRFDVKTRVNIEPGVDGAPRFKIEIDEVKKRELDGFSGVVAKFLGQYFDELVTQLRQWKSVSLEQLPQ